MDRARSHPSRASGVKLNWRMGASDLVPAFRPAEPKYLLDLAEASKGSREQFRSARQER